VSVIAAVDLGASNGRVIAGVVDGGGVQLTEVHRFANESVRDEHGTLRWNITGLYAQILDGLRRLADAFGPPLSIGVDSWAVDYGLLDSSGELLREPVHYRDERNQRAQRELFARVPARELFDRTGVQPHAFNTIVQLHADRCSDEMHRAAHAALIPDLICYWLTGELGTEVTNASTTQLLDPRTGQWDVDLAARAGVDIGLFPPLRHPGASLGLVNDVRAHGVASPPVQVTTVASHDTASAVCAVPATDGDLAFVATGTWSLVGVEVDQPVITPAALTAGFTNEVGVGGKIRLLRNVNGFWLIQQYVEELRRDRPSVTQADLLAAAADESPSVASFDVQHPIFDAPGPMAERVHDACRERGFAAPATPPALTRCILTSMASGIARALDDACRLAGTRPVEVHLVGGGARSALLCRLVADVVDLPVTVGPVEAAAWGNVLIQAQALGLRPRGLPALRADVRRNASLTRYLPRPRVG
jgi:rhamnulokinase